MASPVLSRPPLLTRDLTSFERAYYLYQKRLNERLAMPFSRYFYYNKGTPADPEWKRKLKARKTPSRDIGVYTAYGDEGWNDEVLVGDKTAERENVVEALIRDAEGKNIVDDPQGEGAQAVAGDGQIGEGQRLELSKIEVERPSPRVTEADQKGDTKSLNRKLDRTLYLLIKNKEGRWRFPEDRVYGRENLHQVCSPSIT
jgi:large subunit ribosomal protein L46